MNDAQHFVPGPVVLGHSIVTSPLRPAPPCSVQPGLPDAGGFSPTYVRATRPRALAGLRRLASFARSKTEYSTRLFVTLFTVALGESPGAGIGDGAAFTV